MKSVNPNAGLVTAWAVIIRSAFPDSRTFEQSFNRLFLTSHSLRFEQDFPCGDRAAGGLFDIQRELGGDVALPAPA